MFAKIRFLGNSAVYRVLKFLNAIICFTEDFCHSCRGDKSTDLIDLYLVTKNVATSICSGTIFRIFIRKLIHQLKPHLSIMKKVIFSVLFSMLIVLGPAVFAFTANNIATVVVDKDKDKDKDKKKKKNCEAKKGCEAKEEKKGCCASKEKKSCASKAEQPAQ